MLSGEQYSELAEKFPSLEQRGVLPVGDVQEALRVAGIDAPGFQVRELLERYGDAKELTIEQFHKLFCLLRSERDEEVNGWKQRIGSATGTYTVFNRSSDEIIHTIRVEEEVAFANWINSSLRADPDLQRLLPVKTGGGDLYSKVEDGLLICKLVNLAVPDTIDERAMNKRNLNTYTKLENLTLALLSAQAIGCNIVNIDADDLSKGKPHLVLGLLWQIIRVGLFNQIDLTHVPGLLRLLRKGETLDSLRKLSPEEILLRWVNCHLEKAGVNRRITNFTTDITDSEVYTYLLSEVAPGAAGVSLSPLRVKDDVGRAAAMLRQAEKLSCRTFVTPSDVAQGNYKLNLAFVANLFSKHPGLPELSAEETVEIGIARETREEKMYRNWMNSMGVTPHVNYLYSDLTDGCIILQLYDVICPGIVNWKRVVTKFSKLKGMMDQIENCNYCVELGKLIGFSLVGIQGKDIYDANQTLTLALVWQLMRAYTLTVLARCTHSGRTLASEREIVTWVNAKLASSGKNSHIKSFQDPSIATACVVIDLIDAVKPGIIDYSLVKSGGFDAKYANAKYAITSGRKIGAKIYALPEDIIEVKPRMVMTVFACLMACDYMPDRGEPAPQPVGPAVY